MTPQQLVLGRVQMVIDDWEGTWSENAALAVLVCWAHLRRFDPATLDDEVVKRINTLVRARELPLCKRVLWNGRSSDRASLKNFVTEVKKHDEWWDNPMSESEEWLAEKFVRDSWRLLDDWSLVAYAIKKLGYAHFPRFARLAEDVETASNFVVDRPDVLLHAACGTAAMHAAYREDLHAFDEELAETTLKHFALVELHEEQQRT